MPKPDPVVLKAVIAPIAGAIKIGGQDGETARITLDVYDYDGGEVDLNALMALRNKELDIVLKEVDD